MSGFQKALPIGLAVFCGVIGGVYTFQPVLAPKDLTVDGREKTRGSHACAQAPTESGDKARRRPDARS
ncbi:hypothetical protein PCL_04840 [Purpureocillium lilacinum]|uniref:Uncharacterized protein n=1 Tax=Purpureocillium lilacinum TaxID=33203 RepID=A0A2U3DWU1_PURLI|nr:hypothetical protein Purlil1_11355 [Purpureocillium lilacinum]PWI66702.1 hypothetical protein PCL_04840 [Purpureocillium lilacinum]